MLHRGTAIEYGTGRAAAIAPPIVGADMLVEEINQRRRRAAERAVDEVLADSFPASDPPSWNAGIARPSPASDLDRGAKSSEPIAMTSAPAPSIDTLDVSRPDNSDRTVLRGLVSLAGAAGVALLAPYAIVLLLVVWAARAVLEPIASLCGVAVPWQARQSLRERVLRRA